MQNAFLDALIAHQSGGAVAVLNDKFSEMKDAVLSTHGKGSITVTLELKPSKVVEGVVEQVETDIKVKLNKPDAAVGKGLFFVHPISRELTRDRVNLQRELNLEGSR